MRALIDGDILLWRVGCATEKESPHVAIRTMEELVISILTDVKATDHIIYFSDSRDATFRAKINPEYKANRTQPKPSYYEELKMYLTNNFNTRHEKEQEADDGMGIDQTEHTIICSIDKDLLQIPGHHYNFVKKNFSFVTPEEGELFFYKQLLMGDKVDNIEGIRGIGPAKAGKLLDGELGSSTSRLFSLVRERYTEHYKDEGDDRMLINGICLKIRQEEDEVWSFPIMNSSQETEQK